MSFIFDVLIPKNQFCKLNLSELLIKWGDEFFSQEPPKYEYKLKLVFHQVMDMSYYQSFNVKNYDVNSYVALSLEGRQLSNLEFLVNSNKEQEILCNEIILFLIELYNTLDSFSILLLRDEECIDNRYDIKDKKELIGLICNSLKEASPEGVIICKTNRQAVL